MASLGEFLNQVLSATTPEGLVDVEGNPPRSYHEDFRLHVTEPVADEVLHNLMRQHYEEKGFKETQRVAGYMGRMMFQDNTTELLITLTNASRDRIKIILISVRIV